MEFVRICFIIFFWVYLSLSIFFVSIGMMAMHFHENCSGFYRFEYVIPARHLGCWLAEKIDGEEK
jgi:hypothetical protein